MERLLFECAIRSTLIAALAAAVLWATRIKNVATQHSTWTSALVFMLALPLLVASGRSVPLRILPPLEQNVEQVAQFATEKVPFVPPKIGQAFAESPRAETKAGRAVWPQWIEGIYFLGVSVLLLRLLTGMIGAHRLKRQARRVDGRLTSASCFSPITVGWVHAMTILPEGWQDWQTAKLDAVLTHESEHARRYDPLVQWLALVNRALFWFHPLAWWLERRLAALSEEACDCAVLERGHDASDYAVYLLDLARCVSDSHQRIRPLGMAMPGAYLPQRIQKILRDGIVPKVSFLRMVLASAVFFLLSVGLSTGTLARARFSVAAAPKTTPVPAASTPAAEVPETAATEKGEEVRRIAPQAATPQVATPAPVPKFEVASVKPCAPGDGAGRGEPGQRGGGAGGRGYITSPGKLFVNCVSVSEMINTYLMNSAADRLINDSSAPEDPRRVRGGPAWVYSDRYTINAETSDRAAAGTADLPAPTPRPSIGSMRLLMGPMLRLLLEDRFRLKTRRDTEEVAMYSLTIAKGGLKIKPMEEGGCAPFDPDKNRPRDTPPGPNSWCIQGIGIAESDWTINGAGQPMSNFAAALSTVMSRHVFDKTGLSGLFNYNVRFAHDDTTPGEIPPGMPSPFPQSDVPAGPSVFTVLEEQLGLKLVPDRGPRGYLVIDHVERPSEN